VTCHWGIPDPAADHDFEAAYERLRQRVEALVHLPLEEFDAAGRRAALERIHADFD
jgi:hypothetical protein